ncbi:MAG: aromatic amino acid ammonia-lyase [Conexivisphaerales archaeon]|nr:aromatic amino acid ammonia-lyase [Conexivisphaerales archaeon]
MKLGSLTFDDVIEISVNMKKVQKVDEKKYDEELKIAQDLASKQTIYGVNTLLGELANEGKSSRVDPEEILKMHAVGVGKQCKPEWVRAAMLIRANQLAQGRSAVRGSLINHILNMINRGITPAVPELGSVGASGDLIPLAHIGLAIAGEGKVVKGGKVLESKEVLKQNGIEPYRVNLREALALINATSFSSGVFAVELYRSLNVIISSLISSILILEASKGSLIPNSKAVNSVKLHNGPRLISEIIENSLSDSRRLGSAKRVQDPYSIRCSSQLLGAALDSIAWAKRNLENEINSSSDNPILVDGSFMNTCNFHGQYVAYSSDLVREAVSAIVNLEERRSAQLLRKEINGYKDHLGEIGGVGYMLMQYASAGLSALGRQLSFPAAVNNIPTSGFQEDTVSMSYNSAYMLSQLNDIAFRAVSISLVLEYLALKIEQCSGCGKISSMMYSTIENRFKDNLSETIENISSGINEMNKMFLEKNGLSFKSIFQKL